MLKRRVSGLFVCKQYIGCNIGLTNFKLCTNNPYYTMRNHFQLNFDPRRSPAVRAFIYLFKTCSLIFLTREIILLEHKYKNGWHKVLKIIEKKIVLYPTQNIIFTYFQHNLQLFDHGRAKSLRKTDIVSAIL